MTIRRIQLSRWAVTLLVMAIFMQSYMAAESDIEYADDIISADKTVRKTTASRILYPNDILVGEYLITDEAISGRRCILETKSGKYVIPSSVADLKVSVDFITGRVDARDDVDKKWNLGPVVYFSLELKQGNIKWFKDREMKQALGNIWSPE